MDDSATAADLELPGFRFHPTEEELLDFYLKNMLLGKKLCNDIIGFLNIYHHDPWDLPGMAKIGEREWYFFVPRNSKHGSGGRPNRTTKKGFWKATGSDRKILSLSNSNPKKLIGLKKTLVFYTGRSPRGSKTDWVMNEYRLPLGIHTCPAPDAVVLCKIYRKATSLRVLEQRAAIDQKEEEMKGFNSITDAHGCGPSSPSLLDAVSICNQHDDMPTRGDHHVALKKEDEEELSSVVDKKIIDDDDDDDDHDSYKCRDNSTNNKTCTNNLRLPTTNLTQLQVPNKLSMDWTQDPFWTQLRSPWLDITFTPYYANVLNF